MPELMIKCVGKDIESVEKTQLEEAVLPFFHPSHIYSFRHILSFLNDKDKDILYLIFVARKKQKDVQRILGRSQPSLCYDIKRIRRRLKFIFYLHSVSDLFLSFVEESRDHFTKMEMEILILMFYTSSFTMTSGILGISQGRARYSYQRSLNKMKSLKMWDIYEIFSIIRTNLNIVKRIYKTDD